MKPILFQIPIPSWLGGEALVFPSYYVMLSLSFMAAIVLASRYAQKNRMNVNHVLDVGLFVIAGILIGMRLFFTFQKYERYWYPFSWEKFKNVFEIWEGGIVLYGGLIGGILLGIVGTLWRRVQLTKMMDVGIFSVGLGMFFTRIGCFLNGCCHGDVTMLPWGVVYPADSIVFSFHKGRGWVSANDPHSLPVHPTQLYESFSGLLIFFFFIWFWPRRKFHGQMFAMFGMIYAFQRFLIEYSRGDPVRGDVGPFSTSQFVGFFFFGIHLLVYLYLKRRAHKKGLLLTPEEQRGIDPPISAPIAIDARETV